MIVKKSKMRGFSALIKTFGILIMGFYAEGFFAQVTVDSPLYQTLKLSGQLGTVQVIPGISTLAPAKVKPNNSNKASACNCYVEPDGTYTLAMQPNDDGSSVYIPIPFSFNLYGTNYTGIYINNNGNITFNGPMAIFSASAFPSTINSIVAPFWADVDTRNGFGQVVYKITPTAVYINWEDVGYFNMHGDKLNTFQLIITNGSDPVIQGGNVAFCYQDMEWTTGDASSGINGFYGIPATCGANSGDGTSYFLISYFDHAGGSFDGPQGQPDGIDWLDNKSFAFDASNTGNIPPIAQGIASCDTFKICSIGDTAIFSLYFLSPEVNQTTSISFSSGGLSTLTQLSNTSGNTANIILQAVGTSTNLGIYNVLITATDNNVPPGITVVPFVIQIDTTLNALDSSYLLATNICGSVDIGVALGPYDTYLWDDFSIDSTATLTSSQNYGVTVSLDGCYRYISSNFIIAQPVAIPLQGNFSYCPPDTATLIGLQNPGSYSSINWGLSNPVLNNQPSVYLPIGSYTVTVMDSLGLCQSDTTFLITGANSAIIFNDTLICDPIFQAPAAVSNGGTWTSTSNQVSFNNANSLSPIITFGAPGIYSVSFADNACNQVLNTNITLPMDPAVQADVAICGLSYSITGTQAAAGGGQWSYVSTLGNTINYNPSNQSLNPSISTQQAGIYQMIYTDAICNESDTFQIQFQLIPAIDIDTLACNYQFQVTGTISDQGGLWTASDTCIHFVNATSNNPMVWTQYAGIYTLTFTDDACNVALSAQVHFPPYLETVLFDTSSCAGTSINLIPFTLPQPQNSTLADYTLQSNYVASWLGLWDNGSTMPSLSVTDPGIYTYTASNDCYSSTDSALVNFYLCEIIVPNIISLSSTAGNQLFFVNSSGIVSFHCAILNRWGNLIYEFNDANGSWDGMDKSGKIVTEGTYFYLIDAVTEGGKEIQLYGFVVLEY